MQRCPQPHPPILPKSFQGETKSVSLLVLIVWNKLYSCILFLDCPKPAKVCSENLTNFSHHEWVHLSHIHPLTRHGSSIWELPFRTWPDRLEICPGFCFWSYPLNYPFHHLTRHNCYLVTSFKGNKSKYRSSGLWNFIVINIIPDEVIMAVRRFTPLNLIHSSLYQGCNARSQTRS